MSTERILVVSPYPPARDGIGAFAVQQVKALRRAGNHVEVCSPRPSAAHHHIDLRGPRGALALRRLIGGFDRVIVHFHPDFFYDHPATPTSRISTGLAYAAALRSGPPVTIRLHEIDHRWVAPSDPSAFATRALFRAASRVEVHVPDHARQMVDEFNVDRDKVVLVEHGADFVARTDIGREEARRTLGLDQTGHVFLCIGFVQPHKGFDRAMTAFGDLGALGASLHVVGSVRIDDPAAADHQRELEALASRFGGTHLHLGYVSDEAFDRWIVAADTVVLPYRHIWSSSVAERARLLGRPVIATRVGGLADQLADDPTATIVDGNNELAVAMRSVVTQAVGEAGRSSRPSDAPGDRTGWGFDGRVDRDTVMAEVARRSAATRGLRARPIDPGRNPARPAADRAPVALSLRRLRAVPPPPAASARPGVSTVKKVIRRVIGWEIDPLREQVIRLQQATLQAAETTEARLEAVEDATAEAPPGPSTRD